MFNVSQKGDRSLKLLRDVFQCGYVRKRFDDLHYFEILDFKQIQKYVIPFFIKFPLRSEKAGDFLIFEEVAEMFSRGEHLTLVGMKRILKLRQPMNYGGKNRRLKTEFILGNLKGSSETIRQNRSSGKI